MQNVIQKHDNIKINTVFNGEFVSDDKKMMQIKVWASEIMNSSVHLIYTSHIIEPILSLLEDFQERDSMWMLSRWYTEFR